MAMIEDLLRYCGAAGGGDWRGSALCAQTDPEVFFPTKGQPTQAAKAVCAACPVRPQCLEDALADDVRFGVWGGLSTRERLVLTAATT